MKVGVIGLGNTLVADDGVGIETIRQFREAVADERLTCVESQRGGLDLLDWLMGFDAVFLIDATRTGVHPPGWIASFTLRQPFQSPAYPSSHTINLCDVLAFGSMTGLRLPDEVTVITVEAADIETYHEGCTPEVRSAIPIVVSKLREQILQVLPDLRIASHVHIESPV